MSIVTVYQTFRPNLGAFISGRSKAHGNGELTYTNRGGGGDGGKKRVGGEYTKHSVN